VVGHVAQPPLACVVVACGGVVTRALSMACTKGCLNDDTVAETFDAAKPLHATVHGSCSWGVSVMYMCTRSVSNARPDNLIRSFEVCSVCRVAILGGATCRAPRTTCCMAAHDRLWAVPLGLPGGGIVSQTASLHPLLLRWLAEPYDGIEWIVTTGVSRPHTPVVAALPYGFSPVLHGYRSPRCCMHSAGSAAVRQVGMRRRLAECNCTKTYVRCRSGGVHFCQLVTKGRSLSQLAGSQCQ
jgi:hypothetical protein